MDISIISVFPEYFDSMQLSLLGKAQAHGIVRIQALDLRDWTHDVHRSVDDTPAGGGAGMVMKPEVWAECLDDVLGTAGASAVSSSHPEPSDSAAVSASG
ncbi:MAG: tRNA (guanosine(37)-N1)-methyltransferase TrmD, partial [Scardovia wiggsiae]